MRRLDRSLSLNTTVLAVSLLAGCSAAACQMGASAPAQGLAQAGPAKPASAPGAASEAPNMVMTPAVQTLLAFKDSDVKFSIAQLMDILRDKRHEGWVLAAYPDPKTSRPLIGAGFSLDLPAREHPQLDPLNANQFFEPSSAELWQAAGLDPAQLAKILDEFHEQLNQWTARKFRRNIRFLQPQITSDDAEKLLRIAIVQSIVNARAYCRNFNQLTASQQMALSQMVYQMGVNLEGFTQFRAIINHETPPESSGETRLLRNAAMTTAPANGTDYWKSVQQSLEQSQWARLYRARAVAVIAMFDPQYGGNPAAAERRVSAVLRPAVNRRRRARAAASTELVADRTKHQRAGHGKRAHVSGKKTA